MENKIKFQHITENIHIYYLNKINKLKILPHNPLNLIRFMNN